MKICSECKATVAKSRPTPAYQAGFYPKKCGGCNATILTSGNSEVRDALSQVADPPPCVVWQDVEEKDVDEKGDAKLRMVALWLGLQERPAIVLEQSGDSIDALGVRHWRRVGGLPTPFFTELPDSPALDLISQLIRGILMEGGKTQINLPPWAGALLEEEV